MEFAFRTSARPPAMNGTPKHSAERSAYFIAEFGSGVNSPESAVPVAGVSGVVEGVLVSVGTVVDVVEFVVECDAHTGEETSALRDLTSDPRDFDCSEFNGT